MLYKKRLKKVILNHRNIYGKLLVLNMFSLGTLFINSTSFIN